MEESKQIEERYLGAATSGNLRLSLERPGDVDLLVASGWARETMATLLYRLRGEFDAAKGNMRSSRIRTDDLHAQAAEVRNLARAERRKVRGDASAAEDLEARDRALRQQAADEAVTARALILMQLRSLDRTTRALRHFGEQQAARRGFRDVDVNRVAGQSLDAMLDSLCTLCNGVGYFGGYGKRKVLCGGDHGCRGSGRRRIDFGSIEANAFGKLLLAEMERKLACVDALMVSFLGRIRGRMCDVPFDSALVSSPMIELQRRLSELRGDQANAD